MPKTEAERIELLEGLGLNTSGDLAQQPAKTRKHEPTTDGKGVTLAPPGVDPRLMDVKDIEFDPKLLDGFPSLKFNEGGSAASRYVFDLYKSYGKDPHRNGLLHRKIGSFIENTRRARETGGMVKEKVRATAPERDMAQVIASQGVTTPDLVRALELLKAEKEKEGSA